MDNLNNIPNVGNWGDAASRLNDNFNKIKQAVTTVENASKNNKGYFTSLSALNTAFPSPKDGQTAYVYDEGSSTNYYIYNAVDGEWVASSIEAPSVGVDLEGYTKTGGSTKTTKEVEDDLAQLADSVKNANPNYSLINFVNGEIDISGDKITFIRNPLLYNLSTGHRVYLFPQNTSFPHEVTLNQGKLTALPVSVFESANAASYLPSDSFVEIDYGATTDDLIVLWGRSSSTLLHYLGISTRYTNTLKPPLYDFIDSFELVTGYTLEQGGITNGVLNDRDDRIRTSFIEAGFLSRIEVPPTYKYFISYYDINKEHLHSTDFFLNSSNHLPVKGAFYVRVVFGDQSNSNLLPETFGEKIYCSPLTAINPNDLRDKRIVEDDAIVMTQGSISTLDAHEFSRTDRIRSGYIAVNYIERLEFNPGFEVAIFSFDKEKNYHVYLDFASSPFEGISVDGFIRIVVRATGGGDIQPDAETGLKLTYVPKYALYGTSGVPEGGESGDVLTPEGWQSGYAKITDVNEQLILFENQIEDTVDNYKGDTDAQINALENFVSGNLSEKVSYSDLSQSLSEYQKKNEPALSLAPNTVTPQTLSESTIQLIETSGGGTITNLPDDEDITSEDNLLKLKDTDVTRFRLKATPAENYQEMLRCLSTGMVIEIKDSVDLSHSDGSIRTINLDGHTLKFVGNGRIKNCLLLGSLSIDAERRQIFDNVYFHRWRIGGVDQINKDSINNIYLTGTDMDIYNLRIKELSVSNTTTPVNPFNCSFTALKIGSFFTPVLEGGQYVYKENNNTLLTFVQVDDKIRIPIRKDYVFTDDAGNIIESTVDIKTKETNYVEIDPSNVRVSRLIPPTLNRTAVIKSNLLPEWFGAISDNQGVDNTIPFQTMHVCQGVIDFSPSSTYYLNGDVRVYGGIIINGNKSILRLKNNSTAKCLYEVETRERQDEITIYDLNLEGNKSNNTLEQDGIYIDFHEGRYQPFNGYSVNNTYWYNLKVQNFTGSGIVCGSPGTSHIYSSYFSGNNVDGISWAVEHFTLMNCTCWGNGRHGVFASGNHWRIIGGAYAHNGAGDNIHCLGAFESQIIGCSTIDSGRFIAEEGGGYEASPLNVYGYIWVGEGQGTHKLVGGNGIYLRDCSSISILGVRINNQNADGIHMINSTNIVFANGQINAPNMTRGEWGDVGGSHKANLRIDNSLLSTGFIVSNYNDDNVKWFGRGDGEADWNNLMGTFNEFGFGSFEIRDSYVSLNRPLGASTHLSGRITILSGQNGAIGRVFIELMDENCNRFYRHFHVNMTTGAYSNDTGWK
jgi:hypothetical protein